MKKRALTLVFFIFAVLGLLLLPSCLKLWGEVKVEAGFSQTTKWPLLSQNEFKAELSVSNTSAAVSLEIVADGFVSQSSIKLEKGQATVDNLVIESSVRELTLIARDAKGKELARKTVALAAAEDGFITGAVDSRTGIYITAASFPVDGDFFLIYPYVGWFGPADIDGEKLFVFYSADYLEELSPVNRYKLSRVILRAEDPANVDEAAFLLRVEDIWKYFDFPEAAKKMDYEFAIGDDLISTTAADVKSRRRFDIRDRVYLYTVAFHAIPEGCGDPKINAGSVIYHGSFCAEGTTDNLFADAFPGVDYVFLAWYDDPGMEEAHKIGEFDPLLYHLAAGEVPQFPQNLDIYANYGPAYFEIAIDIDPSDSGTITVDNVEVSIPYAGDHRYGEEVRLEAFPADCYDFVGWYENGTQVSISNPYAFVVYNERSLTARFTTSQHAVKIDPEPQGAGKIKVDGAAAVETYEATHLCGSSVEAEAVPGECHYFRDWTEDSLVLSTERTYEILVNGDRAIKANFLSWDDLFDSLVTVSVYHGLGIASYNIVLRGNASELPPEVVELEIWPDTGVLFVGGYGEEEGPFSQGTPYALTGAKLDATDWPHEITLTYGEGETLNDYPKKLFIRVNEAQTCVVEIAVPQPAWENWGSSHSLFTEASPEEGGIVEGAGTYEAGQKVQLTALPAENFEFVNWTTTAGDLESPNDAETNFKMPTEDATVTANFVRAGYKASFKEVNNLAGVSIQLYKYFSDPFNDYLPVGDPLITDVNGEASTNLEKGSYQFKASKQGYEDFEVGFDVNNKNLDFQIAMQAKRYAVNFKTTAKVLTGQFEIKIYSKASMEEGDLVATLSHGNAETGTANLLSGTYWFKLKHNATYTGRNVHFSFSGSFEVRDVTYLEYYLENDLALPDDIYKYRIRFMYDHFDTDVTISSEGRFKVEDGLEIDMQMKTDTYDSPGTYLFRNKGQTKVFVEAWGGGGGGGGRSSGRATTSARGGGGGAYARSVVTIADPAYYIVVGAGGNGGIGTNNGKDGQPSTFGTDLVVAAGGKGGSYIPKGSEGSYAGAGGSVDDSVGDVKYGGGDGDNGGGGGAGSTENGENSNGNASGAGGYEGGGAGGWMPVYNGSNNGQKAGGGGSGAYRTSNGGTQNGGNGADGKVRITYIEIPSAILMKINYIDYDEVYREFPGTGWEHQLIVRMSVQDYDGYPVPDAYVTATIYRNNSYYRDLLGYVGLTTDFYISPPLEAGSYKTTVQSLEAAGYLWDGVTPNNGKSFSF